MSQFDQVSFRSALGRFATGVTIITARGRNGRAVGVTANSFNSVSLDPPLVLWSLSSSSSSREVFEEADEFAIHVLGIDQLDLSNRFAARGIDKFEGIEIGESGAPRLDGCAAHFRCRRVQRHDVGDHVLFIGEVLDFNTRDADPLLYLQGSYGEARRKATAEAGYDIEAAQLGKGALLNLFSYAYVGILARLREKFTTLGLIQPIPIVLAALAEGYTSRQAIEAAAAERDFQFTQDVMEQMAGRDLIAEAGDQLRLLPAGEALYRNMLVALKDVEDRLEAKFTQGELAEARHFLAKLGEVSR